MVIKKQLNLENWEDLFTLIGTIIGAGMLALPYVFNKFGYFNAVLILALSTILMVLINLELVQIILKTNGKKEFVSLGEKYLGKIGKWCVVICFFLTQIGALITYILGIHIVLNSIFGGFIPTIIVLILANFFIFLKMKKFNDFSSVLSLTLLVIVLIISTLLLTQNSLNVLSNELINPEGFGVILFSLVGFSVIPEIVWNTKNKSKISKIILITYLVVFMTYIFFIFSFLTTYGNNINEIAITNLPNYLKILGGFLSIILLLTSYLTIARSVQKTLRTDLNLKVWLSYALTIITPPLITILGFVNFVQILDSVGLYLTSCLIILIILMYEKAKTYHDKKSPIIFNIPKKFNQLIILILLVLMINKLLF